MIFLDLRRYLASVFIAKEKEYKYFSTKLSLLTDNYAETVRRERIIDGKNYPKKMKIEAYLLHKLNFILKQKKDEFFESLKYQNFSKRRRSTDSKYTEPKEESKGKPSSNL